MARLIYSGTRRFVDVEALPTRTEVDAIAAEQTEISCYDGCNIQFTSGSTGKPKAAFLSHRAIVNNSLAVKKHAIVSCLITKSTCVLKRRLTRQLENDPQCSLLLYS